MKLILIYANGLEMEKDIKDYELLPETFQLKSSVGDYGDCSTVVFDFVIVHKKEGMAWYKEISPQEAELMRQKE